MSCTAVIRVMLARVFPFYFTFNNKIIVTLYSSFTFSMNNFMPYKGYKEKNQQQSQEQCFY